MKEFQVCLQGKLDMEKLAAVEEAKALFEEAKEWGVWRWLLEKSRARRTADAAWKALDKYEHQVKGAWSAERKKAFREEKALHAAEAKAHEAHMAAEAQFDDADRRLSASMACEGAQMAIDAWTKREKYIRKLEAFGRQQQARLTPE
jgi:hypothetical protein